MDEEKYSRRKSGQIPPFGNWEKADDMPITQYFECARQAGLLRFSHSSGDLYAVDLNNISSPPTTATTATAAAAATTKKMNGQVAEEKRRVKEEQGINEPAKKQTYYLSKSQPQKQRKAMENVNRTATATAAASKTVKVKAVDEDLYKIPPHLLCSSKAKRKKRLGFVSRCLVPDCMV
ncbi:hypothetical protein NMG60_11031051 [Bertholletia excelsa]